MRRNRVLFSVATLTLSLLAVEAEAITLPDTTSPCSTGSADGCLKITNTDSTDYGSPAITAITQSQYGAAVSASGSADGVDAYGGNIGVNSTGGNLGVYGSGSQWGIYGTTSTASSYAVYGSASNASSYGVYGNNTSGIGVGVHGSGNPGMEAVGTTIGLHATSPVIGVFGQATGSDTTDYGISGTSQNGSGVYGFSGSSGRAVYGDNSSSAGWAGYFNGKVYAAAGYTSSDARLKKDVASLSYGLKDLAALRPITFKWKDPSRGDARNIGFLAQDLQKVVPEVVDQDARSGMLSVNYPGLVPVLVKAIQEQQVVIARQDARIQALEQRPLVSSMFSGGINVSVAIGALGALVLNIIRRRRERRQTP
ncbi:MAG TPA: tail fiber domain-containing protein [Polyangia bacterium]|nr:tail fiber domain-containing protein [Polyangia bacterium]